MTRLWLWIPLALIAAFCALAAWQLSQPKDNFVHSAMIGKPLPEFSLRPALAGGEGVSRADFSDGKPRLLNLWASWCLPCIAEAQHLQQLQQGGAQIIGVAIKDRPQDVARFLTAYGNPYFAIGADDMSSLQTAIGSSGVPETFVIDGQGTIVYQHIGDIRQRDVPMLLEKLREAEQ